MIAAIHQPNYAPWCGYFAKMRSCDIFVFLDDVQMPSRGNYVSRALISGQSEPKWLSVPVHFKPGDRIADVRIADGNFSRKHLGSLRAVYSRSSYFREVFSLLESHYAEPGNSLADFNMGLIRAIARYLKLPCRFERSTALRPQGESDDRLISLTQLVGADTYLSGKGGQNYQDPAKFCAANIKLDVRTYVPIPYAQNSDNFTPGLSIFDVLFHLGPAAVDILAYESEARTSETLTPH